MVTAKEKLQIIEEYENMSIPAQVAYKNQLRLEAEGKVEYDKGGEPSMDIKKTTKKKRAKKK